MKTGYLNGSELFIDSGTILPAGNFVFTKLVVVRHKPQIRFVVLLMNLLSVLGHFESFSQTKKLPELTPQAEKTQQQFGLDANSALFSRVRSTPDDVIKMFRDAGMSPTTHQLSPEEKEIVSRAFQALPPLHQKILKRHLASISFLDNMPNTALTSPLTNANGFRLFHISFRAGILHQSISEWVTEKERNCYSGPDTALTVLIEAGKLSALTYVLLHEGTHVVDGALGLLAMDTTTAYYPQTLFGDKFTDGIWNGNTKLDWRFDHMLATRNRYRPGGRIFRRNEATLVYNGLRKTPFVSLYSTSSRSEDLAELITVDYLTRVLKQPFRVVVTQKGREVYNYEPMKLSLVSNRIDLLKKLHSGQVLAW